MRVAKPTIVWLIGVGLWFTCSLKPAAAAVGCLAILGGPTSAQPVGTTLTFQAQCCDALGVPALGEYVWPLALLLLAIPFLVRGRSARAWLGLLLLATVPIFAYPASGQGCFATVVWEARSPSEVFTGSGQNFSFVPTMPGNFVVSLRSENQEVTRPVTVAQPCTNAANCDDNNVCNGIEACSAGLCASGTPPVVDDGNPCTADSCDPVTGVSHTLVAAGTSCGDVNACNGTETCDAAGVCVAGTPVSVEDGNPCTVGSCDPATGVVTHLPVPEDTECDMDGCSTGFCSASGECLVDETFPPDDGDPCTIEWCDPELGPQQRTCPALDAAVGATLFNSTEWIYTGTNPVQQGVSVGTIVAERAAALRGTVKTRSLSPLGGVTVTVLGHPEFGSTVTQMDGTFTLVVNGGGNLIVELERQGFLTVQRQVHAGWQEFASFDPIIMIAPDPIVTPITLASSAPFQVARGSLQSDDDGERRGTLLVPASTTATLHFDDGSSAPLSQMSVRITEFTVGATGPDAMPSPLPPQSHYTYAFEVNADEAVDAGAERVVFSQPLVHYVENFLDFPAGTIVPVGSYDRKLGAWKPEENGIVFDIVSESAGAADIDITGDGVADTSFGALGITTAERVQLAALYEPGQSFWRARLSHFTQPWDYNWGVFPPEDATPPTGEPPTGPPPCTDSCCGAMSAGAGPGAAPDQVPNASVIGCREQLLRETIPVAGTPYSLHYASNRVRGRRAEYQVQIPLAGPTVPASLSRIDLAIDIAGRLFETTHAPVADLTVPFEWDGLDMLGREVQGAQRAHITITYVYPAAYAPTSAFGASGSGTPLTGNAARSELYSSRSFDVALGNYHAAGQGLGGWTLSAVNTYEPGTRRLQYGTGGRRESHALPEGTRAVAGWGSAAAPPNPTDGGPALGVRLGLYSMAIDALGRVYASVDTSGQLWRVNRDGTLSRIVPSHNWGRIEEMDVDRDGNLYVAVRNQHVVKRLTPEGVVEVVAGTGTAGFSGDGGPATSARLNGPLDVAVAVDGSIYIYDLNERLRRILPDGTIHTVAGIGHTATAPTVPAPGTRALEHHIELGTIAAAPDGSIYATARIGTATSPLHVLRFDADGTVSAFAGNGCNNTSCPYGQDGLPPLDTSFQPLTAIAVDQANVVYVSEVFRVRVISADAVRTVESIPPLFPAGHSPDGTPALRSSSHARTIALGPDGLYFINKSNPVQISGYGTLYRIQPSLPPGIGANIVVGSPSNEEFWEFDTNGRHLATRHALTGATLLSMSYDASSRISEVRNEVNLPTTIERDASGTPTAIIGPFGQRTELEIGSDGYLASVESPTGETVSMTYHPGGLLSTFTNARTGVSTMTYDAAGRLQTDEDAGDGSQNLFRTGDTRAWSVSRTTALGRTTTYEAVFREDGVQLLSTTHPDETTHTSSTRFDAAYDFSAADGTTTRQTESPEPRFGLSAPLVAKTTTRPSGLIHTMSRTRTYTGLNPFNFLDFTSFQQIESGTAQPGTTTYTRSSRTFLHTNAGSQTTRILDTLGRVSRTQLTSISPVDYFYDTAGRLERVEHTPSRVTRFTYFASGPAAGYLESVIDPLNVATVYTRDAAGRVLTETRAGATTTFDWDGNGNLTSVSPPGKPAHGMTYTPVDLLESYAPPPTGLPLSSTAYTYDADRMLRTETRPTSEQIVRTPDGAGRLDTVSFPGGLLDYDYYPASATSGAGKPSAIAGPYGVDLGFTYDGFLTTGTTWSGDVSGSVAWQYNTDLLRSLETVGGATGTGFTAFGYDGNYLLTCASPTTCSPVGTDALAITRGGHRMPTLITLGNTEETLTYNTFGELATQTANYSGSPFAQLTYHVNTAAPRDALGRILQKTEVIGGVSKVFNYEYDDLGRLEDVFVNGVLDEHFGYDLNGNRTAHFSAATGATVIPTYDDQDRLLTYGTWTFTYTANGELETKTNNATGDEWIFAYDVLGSLLSVGLPNGSLVEYMVDGVGRRVGKKLNGVVTKQWIYRDALKPVAELDGAGNLVAQFVYGSKGNVPDYVRRAGATYRVVSDQLGSPRYVVNVANSGDVPFTASYSAFGSVSGIGLDWMPFGFAGGHYDPDTGLTRFGARDYDRMVGRWTSKDPIRFEGDGANLYGYVLSDPINALDQNGRFGIWIARAAAGCLLLAMEEGYRLYPHHSAKRHCYASCLASRHCTYPLAMGAGLFIEVVGLFNDDWSDDLEANAFGAAVGARPYYLGDNDCTEECEEYGACRP